MYFFHLQNLRLVRVLRTRDRIVRSKKLFFHSLLRQARRGAFLRLVFLGSATDSFHDFWQAAPEDQQGEMIAFMKNRSLMGTRVFLIANGAGPATGPTQPVISALNSAESPWRGGKADRGAHPMTARHGRRRKCGKLQPPVFSVVAIAQLVRALDCDSRGRGFESR